MHDERSFLAFVKALVEDRRLADRLDEGPYGARRGWQNDSIADFLESAVAWTEDSDFGRNQGVPVEASPWCRAAIFLYCGKIYE